MINFNKLIDNYFSRSKREKTIGRYYPSEIGGCLRKIWFSYKIPKETDKDTIRILEAGNNLHELITNILRSEKNPEIELLECELPFKQDEGDFIISGRIDNLILVKDHSKKILIEVKSAKFLPKEAKEAHIQQLQLYMHNTKVYDGIVLYIQKDNLQAKWFEFSYDKIQSEEIIKRFHALHHCLKNEIIPPAEAKIISNKSWMCNYCEYSNECANMPVE